jgi:hypothetical protein
MSEYIEMIKDEIELIDIKLEKIETQLKNDTLDDCEIQLLDEANTMYNARLIYCEKVVRNARRKVKKTINQKNQKIHKT